MTPHSHFIVDDTTHEVVDFADSMVEARAVLDAVQHETRHPVHIVAQADLNIDLRDSADRLAFARGAF